MSESTSYDPNAPEGASSPGAQYMSRKDLKWLLISAVAVLIGMIPVYLYMRDKAYKATCVKNIAAIMEAMNIYAANHDDRLPPLYNMGENGEPYVNERGLPYTWVSDIKPFMSTRASFVCPSASVDEYAYSMDPNTGDPIPSTYGFYAPYATAVLSNIDDPNNVVLIAETSNHGSETSYNPVPFASTKNDGFVIGWNNSNFEADKETNLITRLAFRGTASGNLDKGYGRHGVVHAITASRQKKYLKPKDMVADYNPATYSLSGTWRQPIKPR